MIVSNWAKKTGRAFKSTAYPKVYHNNYNQAFPLVIYIRREADGKAMTIKMTRDQWDQLVNDVNSVLGR